MADITLTISNANLKRVIDCFCAQYGYPDKVPQNPGAIPVVMIDNPETKAQFTKRHIVQMIKNVVKSQEGKLLGGSAKTDNDTTVDGNLLIT